MSTAAEGIFLLPWAVMQGGACLSRQFGARKEKPLLHRGGFAYG